MTNQCWECLVRRLSAPIYHSVMSLLLWSSWLHRELAIHHLEHGEPWFLISSKIAIRMHCLETLMVQRANGDIELQEHLRDQQPKIFFLKHCSLCKSTNSGCSLLLQGLVFTAILLASRRSVITSISNHQKRMCFFCVHNRKGFLLGSNFACDGYILGLL